MKAPLTNPFVRFVCLYYAIVIWCSKKSGSSRRGNSKSWLFSKSEGGLAIVGDAFINGICLDFSPSKAMVMILVFSLPEKCSQLNRNIYRKLLAGEIYFSVGNFNKWHIFVISVMTPTITYYWNARRWKCIKLIFIAAYQCVVYRTNE